MAVSLQGLLMLTITLYLYGFIAFVSLFLLLVYFQRRRVAGIMPRISRLRGLWMRPQDARDNDRAAYGAASHYKSPDSSVWSVLEREEGGEAWPMGASCWFGEREGMCTHGADLALLFKGGERLFTHSQVLQLFCPRLMQPPAPPRATHTDAIADSRQDVDKPSPKGRSTRAATREHSRTTRGEGPQAAALAQAADAVFEGGRGTCEPTAFHTRYNGLPPPLDTAPESQGADACMADREVTTSARSDRSDRAGRSDWTGSREEVGGFMNDAGAWEDAPRIKGVAGHSMRVPEAHVDRQPSYPRGQHEWSRGSQDLGDLGASVQGYLGSTDEDGNENDAMHMKSSAPAPASAPASRPHSPPPAVKTSSKRGIEPEPGSGSRGGAYVRVVEMEGSEDPAVINLLLNFVYPVHPRPELSWAVIEPLALVARKYQADVVLSTCHQYVSDIFSTLSAHPRSPAYAWRWLAVAEQLGWEDVSRKCVRFIARGFKGSEGEGLRNGEEVCKWLQQISAEATSKVLVSVMEEAGEQHPGLSLADNSVVRWMGTFFETKQKTR